MTISTLLAEEQKPRRRRGMDGKDRGEVVRLRSGREGLTRQSIGTNVRCSLLTSVKEGKQELRVKRN